MSNEYISPVAGSELLNLSNKLLDSEKSELRGILKKYGVGHQVPALFKPMEANNAEYKDCPSSGSCHYFSDHGGGSLPEAYIGDPGIVDHN